MNKSKHFAAAINPPVGSRKLPYLQIKTIQTMNFNPYYKISFNKPRQKLDMFDNNIYNYRVKLVVKKFWRMTCHNCFIETADLSSSGNILTSFIAHETRVFL